MSDGNGTDTATPTPTDGEETTAATSPTEATATPTNEPSGPTDSPTGEDQPGFGVVLAVVAVLAAALVARRRDDTRQTRSVVRPQPFDAVAFLIPRHDGLNISTFPQALL